MPKHRRNSEHWTPGRGTVNCGSWLLGFALLGHLAPRPPALLATCRELALRWQLALPLSVLPAATFRGLCFYVAVAGSLSRSSSSAKVSRICVTTFRHGLQRYHVERLPCCPGCCKLKKNLHVGGSRINKCLSWPCHSPPSWDPPDNGSIRHWNQGTLGPNRGNALADAASHHNFKKLVNLGFKVQVFTSRHRPSATIKSSTSLHQLTDYFSIAFLLPPTNHMPQSVSPTNPLAVDIPCFLPPSSLL